MLEMSNTPIALNSLSNILVVPCPTCHVVNSTARREQHDVSGIFSPAISHFSNMKLDGC